MSLPPNPYPIDFTLSPQAIEAIVGMNRNAELTANASYWPCIMWAYDRRAGPEAGGVGIGYIERERVDPKALSQVGSLTFVYGVIDRDRKRFAGRTLDFRDGNFVLDSL